MIKLIYRLIEKRRIETEAKAEWEQLKPRLEAALKRNRERNQKTLEG